MTPEPDGQPGQNPPGLEWLTDEVSGDRLVGDIGELARWTKHAGTVPERESLVYVERTLREAGFTTSFILHDAYVSQPQEGWIEIRDRRLPGITHSFSVSTRPEGVTGPLAEFSEGQASGRVVLIDGIASPAAAAAASRAGAIAQIHISPDEHLHEMCVSPVWGSPDDRRKALLPTTAVVTVSRAVGQAIREDLRMHPGSEVTVTCRVDTGWRKTPILTADLSSPQGDDQEPFVLLSGHHDTWHYGVMDNGGANATMLEVARVCAKHRQAWRRGLRLAFWSGHSQGRYSSSAWYADEHWEELERRALVHVNVDSTGGRGNTVVSDTSASAELSTLAEQALQTVAKQPFNGRRMQRAGDQSFWGIGVPSIFGNLSEQPASDAPNPMAGVLGAQRRVGHGTGWWWHTPDDTADKIDPEILIRDTQVYVYAVWRLLTDALLPLDYAKAARAMALRLQELNDQLTGALPLDSLIERCRALAARVERILASARIDPESAPLVNELLRQLSRRLVPIDYTFGDRFAHDPALQPGPIPALSDLSELAGLDPESDDYRFLRSRLIRERNRVGVVLREALDVVGVQASGDGS